VTDKQKQRIKPSMSDVKNQICNETGITNENKTDHYLTRIQMIELLTFIRNLKQIAESKGNEPKA